MKSTVCQTRPLWSLAQGPRGHCDHSPRNHKTYLGHWLSAENHHFPVCSFNNPHQKWNRIPLKTNTRKLFVKPVISNGVNQLGCVPTNRVESSPIKSARVPTGFQYTLNSAKVTMVNLTFLFCTRLCGGVCVVRDGINYSIFISQTITNIQFSAVFFNYFVVRKRYCGHWWSLHSWLNGWACGCTCRLSGWPNLCNISWIGDISWVSLRRWSVVNKAYLGVATVSR